MRRLGKIEPRQTPSKILTLGTEIKKSVSETFYNTHYQSKICKNMFLGGVYQLSMKVGPTIAHVDYELNRR